MVIFREHRGGLAESMETAKVFSSFEEMKNHVYEIHKNFFFSMGYNFPPFEISDIVIDDTSKTDDERIKWHDTMYVCVKRYGNEDYIQKYGVPQCIGMCATDFER